MTEHRDRIAFLGLRGTPDTISAVFIQLTPAEAVDYKLVPLDPGAERQLRYDEDIMRSLKMCKPGAVYACTLEGNSLQYVKHSSPLGFLSTAHRTAWAMEHSGVERAYRAAKAFKADGTRNVIREQLAPVRDAYWKLRGSARAQFLAEVVQYIVGGPG